MDVLETALTWFWISALILRLLVGKYEGQWKWELQAWWLVWKAERKLKAKKQIDPTGAEIH